MAAIAIGTTLDYIFVRLLSSQQRERVLSRFEELWRRVEAKPLVDLHAAVAAKIHHLIQWKSVKELTSGRQIRVVVVWSVIAIAVVFTIGCLVDHDSIFATIGRLVERPGRFTLLVLFSVSGVSAAFFVTRLALGLLTRLNILWMVVVAIFATSLTAVIACATFGAVYWSMLLSYRDWVDLSADLPFEKAMLDVGQFWGKKRFGLTPGLGNIEFRATSIDLAKCIKDAPGELAVMFLERADMHVIDVEYKYRYFKLFDTTRRTIDKNHRPVVVRTRTVGENGAIMLGPPTIMTTAVTKDDLGVETGLQPGVIRFPVSARSFYAGLLCCMPLFLAYALFFGAYSIKVVGLTSKRLGKQYVDVVLERDGDKKREFKLFTVAGVFVCATVLAVGIAQWMFRYLGGL